MELAPLPKETVKRGSDFLFEIHTPARRHLDFIKSLWMWLYTMMRYGVESFQSKGNPQTMQSVASAALSNVQ